VPNKDGEKGRKPAAHAKNNNNQGKRKVKVNWLKLLFN